MKKTFIIIEYCNNEIEHLNSKYEEFFDLLDKNNLINIDFNNKKIQNFL